MFYYFKCINNNNNEDFDYDLSEFEIETRNESFLRTETTEKN
jgi:hypothetical protein